MKVLTFILGAALIFATFFRVASFGGAVDIAAASVAAMGGMAFSWVLRAPITQALRSFVTSSGSLRGWIWLCIIIGVLLRVVCAALIPVEYVSDSLFYWTLAQKIALGEPYLAPEGRSFWPPGLPIALSPLIAAFGPARWIPVVFNLAVFATLVWVSALMAQRLISTGAARLTALLLAIWPNLILVSLMPYKELLAALLLTSAMLFYLRAIDATTGRARWSALIFSGLCLGAAALTQPASVLFGLTFIGVEATMSRAPLSRRLGRLIVAALMAAAVVLPWTARNYAIHDAFIPINTAGGGVIFSANNPNATGGWIADDAYFDDEFRAAGELERNRIGYEKAFAWIAANPADFAKLAFQKEMRLLGGDDHGARTLFAHSRLTHAENADLRAIFGLVSNGFWIMLALLILTAAFTPGRMEAQLWPPLLAIGYFVLLFSLFQSEDRHHVNIAAFFAIIASAVIPRTPPSIEEKRP